MSRGKLVYTGGGCALGVFLLGMGWILSNFYLVALGMMLVASSLAVLTMPRP